MRLWCEPCGRTHRLSPRDVERIVYALLANDFDRRWMSRLPEPEEWCLRDLVDAARDDDGYRAWVEDARARARREPVRRVRLALPAALVLLAAAAAVVALVLPSPGAPPALTANAIGVIDPVRNALVDAVPVGTRPTRLTAGDDAIWVVNADDATVSRIDGERARVTRTVRAPAGAVAAGDAGVWALDYRGRLARIDPDRATVSGVEHLDVGPLRPDETPGLAVGAGGVWAAGRGSVFAIAGGRAAAAEIETPAQAQDVAAGAEAVWVLGRSAYPGGTASALQLDRRTGKTLRSVPVGPDPSAIALGAGSVWATAAGNRTLLRIDAGSGRVQAAIRVGESPSDVAVGAGAVWVANSGDGTVSRVDPRSNRVVATIPLTERPDGIAVAAGRVWVSVY